MEKPLFSVITVCFNSEDSIRKTLESVLAQTYTDYEYIIIDGASTDGTLNIIEEYREKFGGRLRVYSEKDNGIYDAMNKGIMHAEGEIIGFINSNDWYEADALQAIKSHHHGQKQTVYYGMLRVVEEGREKMCWLKRHEFLETQMIAFPSCFITSDVYQKYGGYNTVYKSSADYDFMLNLYKGKETDFYPIYSVISNFCLGGVSGSNIGTLETAKIRYNNGLLPKGRYWCIAFVQRVKIAVKKILKMLGLRK